MVEGDIIRGAGGDSIFHERGSESQRVWFADSQTHGLASAAYAAENDRSMR
jgi:hypothetical protein